MLVTCMNPFARFDVQFLVVTALAFGCSSSLAFVLCVRIGIGFGLCTLAKGNGEDCQGYP